jgi:hypothetical protein
MLRLRRLVAAKTASSHEVLSAIIGIKVAFYNMDGGGSRCSTTSCEGRAVHVFTLTSTVASYVLRDMCQCHIVIRECERR